MTLPYSHVFHFFIMESEDYSPKDSGMLT